MTAIRHLDNSDFPALDRFLSGYAETTMFIRSNLRRSGVGYANKPFHGTYFGYFGRDKILNGVLVQYWNGLLLMQAEQSQILRALLTAFKVSKPHPITGILGEAKQAQIVIRTLNLADDIFRTDNDERLYELALKDLRMPKLIHARETKIVPAHMAGKTRLAHWIKSYEIETLGSEDNEMLDADVAKRVSNLRDRWILLADGKMVSFSGFNATLTDMVQIGPVWTPPEFRGRGYARKLVALSLQAAKTQGVKKAVLFTDNPAAMKAYEAIGFQDIGAYRLALLKEPLSLINYPRIRT